MADARKIAQIEEEIRVLKREINKGPLRTEPALPAGIGEEIHFAYCKVNAPSDSSIIPCYLDDDMEDPAEWQLSHSYSVDDYVNGSDNKAYQCTNAHTSTNDDKPITGENWEDFWELAEIDVHCLLYAASALNECSPLLGDGHILEVAKIEDEWWCVDTKYIGYVECS